VAAQRLADDLARRRPRVLGEVHLRQLGRRNIERDPNDAAFGKVLDLAAQYGVPVVVHYELTDTAAAALSRALAAHRKATLVLAHAGEGPPARVEGLLARNPNLMVDLSGMHFLRKPSLASENGPLDPAWKALIEKMPDRFLMGVDVWAPRLLEPAMLDRLFTWPRRPRHPPRRERRDLAPEPARVVLRPVRVRASRRRRHRAQPALQGARAVVHPRPIGSEGTPYDRPPRRHRLLRDAP